MPFQWPIRVYIEDTDLGGIVFYVNYLKYMERARTELLRHFGYSQQQLLEQDLLFVVSHVDGRYLQPARLDDELLVTVTVERATGARISFIEKITRASDSVLLCQAKVDVACVCARRLKPRRWPTEMLEQLRTCTAQPLIPEEK